MAKSPSRKPAIHQMLGSNIPIKGRNVRIGGKVLFGRNVILYDNVTIEHDTVIGPNVVIGEPILDAYQSPDYRNPSTRIGHSSIIRSGSVIYAGCKLGPRLSTGHFAAIRERTTCGERCSFGTYSTSDGDVRIGDRCRFSYYTHVCKSARIGDDVWLFPLVQLYNDLHPPCNRCIEGPTIGDRVVLGAGSIVLPRVRIGKDAVVAAGSVVTRDIPDDMVAMGTPARVVCKNADVKCSTGKVEQPYPWVTHYIRER